MCWMGSAPASIILRTVLPDTRRSSATSLTFQVPANLRPGNYLFWVQSDGLPSDAKILTVPASSAGTVATAARWTTAGAGTLNAARFTQTATLLPNGKLLVAGGGNGAALTSSELYDPAAGSWSLTGSLNSARRHHTAFVKLRYASSRMALSLR